MQGRRVKPVQRIPPLGVAARQSTDLVAVDDPRLASAMRYLRGHALEAIGVDDIARAAGMSRSLLERRFRATFGDSPWNFALRLRTEAARALLTTTPLAFVEIAERTGFVTAEHLSAMLRRLTGQTPGQIRTEAGLR